MMLGMARFGYVMFRGRLYLVTRPVTNRTHTEYVSFTLRNVVQRDITHASTYTTEMYITRFSWRLFRIEGGAKRDAKQDIVSFVFVYLYGLF